MQPPLRANLLSRLALLAACSLLLATARAQSNGYISGNTIYFATGTEASLQVANYMNFKVSPERAGHTFIFKYKTTPTGTINTRTLNTWGLASSGAVGASAQVIHVALMTSPPFFPLSMFHTAEWWVYDSTAQQDSPHTTYANYTTSSFPSLVDLVGCEWTPTGTIADRYFAIPDSHLGHGLIAGGGNSWTALTTGLTVGTWTGGAANSGSLVSLHWFIASAPAAQPYSVADLNTGQVSPANQSTLLTATWSYDATRYPMANVTLYLDPSERRFAHVLHWTIPGQPEMLRQFDPDLGWSSSSASVTLWNGTAATIPANAVKLDAPVGVGANFWLTRNLDSARVPAPAGTYYTLTSTIANNGTVHAWLLLAPALPVFSQTDLDNWSWVTFGVSNLRANHSFVLKQSSSLSPVEVVSPDQQIADYSTEGALNFFDYFTVRAQVNPAESLSWLVDGATAVASASDPWVRDGWQWIGGNGLFPPPGTPGIQKFKLKITGALTGLMPSGTPNGHFLTLTSPDGTVTAQLSPDESGVTPLTLRDPWHLGSDGFTVPWQTTQATMQLSLPYQGPDGLWILSDSGLSTLMTIGTGGITNYGNDFSALAPPPNPVQLQISSSRWGANRLTLRQRDGTETFINPQGTAADSYSVPGGSGIDFYYYYDADSTVREGIDYWLYDAWTGEESPFNTANLIDWFCTPAPAAPTAMDDGAGGITLQWPLGFASRDGSYSIESDLAEGWQVIGNVAAANAGAVTNLLAILDSPGSFPPEIHYRLKYHYGDKASDYSPVTTFHWRDADHNGLPDDLEAMASILDAVLPPNWARDSDGDGIPDMQETLNGSDPLDFYNGQAPQIIVLAGPTEESLPNRRLHSALRVQVKDSYNNPLFGAPVTIAAGPGGGRIASGEGRPRLRTSLKLFTGSDGIVEFWLEAPCAADAQPFIITAGTTQTQFPVTVNYALGPPGPTDVTAQPLGHGTTVSWVAAAQEAVHFEIERSVDGIIWEIIGTAAGDARSYTDNYVSVSDVVLYRVSTISDNE